MREDIEQELNEAYLLKLKVENSSFNEIDSAISRYNKRQDIAYKLLNEWIRNPVERKQFE